MTNKQLLKEISLLNIDKIRNTGYDLPDLFRFQEKLNLLKSKISIKKFPNINELFSQFYEVIDYVVFKNPSKMETQLSHMSAKLKEIELAVKSNKDLTSSDFENSIPDDNNFDNTKLKDESTVSKEKPTISTGKTKKKTGKKTDTTTDTTTDTITDTATDATTDAKTDAKTDTTTDAKSSHKTAKDTAHKSSKDVSETTKEKIPFYADEEFQKAILKEFKNNILDNLEVIEYAVIDYEKTKDKEYKTEILRMLHTIKSEALAVNFDLIANECHIAEEIITKEDIVDSEKLLDLVDKLKHLSDIKELTDFSDETDETDSEIKDSEPEVLNPIVIKEAEPVSLKLNVEYSDYLGDFFIETSEHLELIQNNLLNLEKSPENKDVQNALFRSFHSIKGIAGFIGLQEINRLTHGVEDMFDLIRNDRLMFSSNIAQISFLAYDKLVKLVKDVEDCSQNGTELKSDPEVLILLNKIKEVIDTEIEKKSKPVRSKTPALSPKKTDIEPVLDKDVDVSKIMKTTEISTSIKVDVNKLDSLVEMIGELVIAESMVNQEVKNSISDSNSISLTKNMRLLEKITRNIQELSLNLRMIPLRTTFRKMERLVRELTRTVNKNIEFIISGEEVELDKGMVEKLGDPLIHMIRNAVDHGVETTDERLKSGKPEISKVYLKAYYFGSNVIIEISDDGKGLNLQKIREKAVKNALISKNQVISNKELQYLIFHPGFSTAEKITNISGRGVGMDVVKKNIEELRGTIEIESSQGKGSSFFIKLPLTLAIIDGMLIKVAGERYILPLQSISEILSPDKSNFVSVAKKGNMIKLRDNLYPLISLRKYFSIENNNNSNSNDESIVVIVEYGDNKVGLLIDELLGQQQIVKKSLGDIFNEQKGITGGSIMADGCVSLIVDVAAIVKSYNVRKKVNVDNES